MGILKHLLFWPVTGPTFLARFALDQVQGVVREELTDDSRVKSALLDLQLRLELGEIDDEEYGREEARFMEELRDVRRWRESLGMATRAGIVSAPGGGVEAGEGDEEGALPRRVTLEVSTAGEDQEEGE